eukprot:253225-Rhodomonas_salina.1
MTYNGTHVRYSVAHHETTARPCEVLEPYSARRQSTAKPHLWHKVCTAIEGGVFDFGACFGYQNVRENIEEAVEKTRCSPLPLALRNQLRKATAPVQLAPQRWMRELNWAVRCACR